MPLFPLSFVFGWDTDKVEWLVLKLKTIRLRGPVKKAQKAAANFKWKTSFFVFPSLVHFKLPGTNVLVENKNIQARTQHVMFPFRFSSTQKSHRFSPKKRKWRRLQKPADPAGTE